MIKKIRNRIDVKAIVSLLQQTTTKAIHFGREGIAKEMSFRKLPSGDFEVRILNKVVDTGMAADVAVLAGLKRYIDVRYGTGTAQQFPFDPMASMILDCSSISVET